MPVRHGMQKIHLVLLMFLLAACRVSGSATPGGMVGNVPHEERWGIYHLDLDTQEVELLYSSPVEIASLRLNGTGDRLLFSRKIDGDDPTNEELFTLGTDGSDLTRLTRNTSWDLYPAWSPDGLQVAFLSGRSGSLGIYKMNLDGSGEQVLVDTPAHEADIDWVGDQIAFTRDSSLWIMQSDGSGVHQLTTPPRAGEWGNTNLPFGDYDPRLSPDGSRVVFERLLDDQSAHGNYDLFLVDPQTLSETRLTETGYSQGLAQWSHAGTQLVFIVAAIGETGQFDIHLMNSDGTGSRNITPASFPADLLCHWAIFSGDDAGIYFIAEWWSNE